MKTSQDVLLLQTSSPVINHDSTKLVSVLALAAGAVAMPQTSRADIIYTDLSSSPVTVGFSGDVSYQVNLPGSALFRFQRNQATVTTTFVSLTKRYRSVVAGDFGPVTSPPVNVQRDAQGFAVPLAFGAAWNQPGMVMAYGIYVGTANDMGGRNPLNGYNNKYLAWQFGDSTQGGAIRYGWIEISLATANYPTGPNVTIFGYGWDNTGAKPTMGQTPVPEPSTMALLVLGAMALGARGVRSWRRNRDEASVA